MVYQESDEILDRFGGEQVIVIQDQEKAPGNFAQFVDEQCRQDRDRRGLVSLQHLEHPLAKSRTDAL